MSNMFLQQVTLSSSRILLELVEEFLPQVIGTPYSLISNDLPYEGHHILVLDSSDKPVLLSCDHQDGGSAFLNALAVLDGLNRDRAWLFRLYPALFTGDAYYHGNFRPEDIQLITLAPTLPPGMAQLCRRFPALSCRVAQAMEVNGEIGLFIEPEALMAFDPSAMHEAETAAIKPFRSGTVTLTEEETRYFNS